MLDIREIAHNELVTRTAGSLTREQYKGLSEGLGMTIDTFTDATEPYTFDSNVPQKLQEKIQEAGIALHRLSLAIEAGRRVCA